MNIFAVSPNPTECAQALDDKRVVKMVLETGQIISSARHLMGLDAPYRPTHLHHPVVLWVAADHANYMWTLHLLRALAEEYQLRYNRPHLTWTKHEDIAPPPDSSVVVPRCFVNVTDFPAQNDVHLAYRWHLRKKWNSSDPRWTKRRPPEWAYRDPG